MASRTTPQHLEIPTGRLLFVLVALTFLSGALVHPLSGEVLSIAGNTEGGESRSIQMLGAAVYLATFGMLILFRIRVPPLAAIAFPAAICAFALLTSVWSADPGLSLRRAVALAGSTLFAVVFAGMFDERRVLTILVRFVALFVLANVLIAVAMPNMAFHQASDLVFGEHAGKLRGTYAHKNDLGHYLGLMVCILVVVGRDYLGKWVGLLTTAAAVVLLLMAGSVSSLMSTMGAIGVLVLVSLYSRESNPLVRGLLLAIAFIIVPIGLFVFFWTPAIPLILESFGRDPTLTARTEIWQYVILAGQSSWLLGAGYGAGWAKAAPILAASPFMDPGNAHNGYLQSWIDMGVVGVGMAIAYVAVAGSSAFRLLDRDGNRSIAPLTLTVVAYFAIINIAGPYIANHNDLLWVTLIVVTILNMRRARAVAGESLPLAAPTGRLSPANG